MALLTAKADSSGSAEKDPGPGEASTRSQLGLGQSSVAAGLPGNLGFHEASQSGSVPGHSSRQPAGPDWPVSCAAHPVAKQKPEESVLGTCDGAVPGTLSGSMLTPGNQQHPRHSLLMA